LIEWVMVFAIGFLTAALLALLILPGLSRRAERLARRRVEARLPTSAAQIAAERDQLRAEIAVEARRIELKAEALGEEHAASLLELGRRDVQIASLQSEMDSRSQALAALEGLHAALIVSDTETRSVLDQTSAELASVKAQLSARETALRTLRDEHRTLSETAEERRLSIAGLETTLEGMRIRIGDLERDVAERVATIGSVRTTLSERDTLVAVLEHKIATLTHEKEERDRVIQTLRTEVATSSAAASAAEKASGEMVLQLAALETRGSGLQDELARARREAHDIEAELAGKLEALRTEKAASEGALEAARAERRAFQHELDALRRERHDETVAIRAENEALRHEIERVAADIIALSTAAAPAGQAQRPERRKVRLAAVEERRVRGSAEGENGATEQPVGARARAGAQADERETAAATSLKA
jgi:chromosome segregation ATPase